MNGNVHFVFLEIILNLNILNEYSFKAKDQIHGSCCRSRIFCNRSSFHFSSKSPCAHAGMFDVGSVKLAIADMICKQILSKLINKNVISNDLNCLPVRFWLSLK